MNETFLKACRSEPTDYTPVWFMRQAGRSLPGYRELRKSYDVLALTQTPELAAQVSIEPVERLGVDAAILFADIMLLPIAMGVDVRIVEGLGPVIDEPILGNDLDRLVSFDPTRISYLQATIRLLRQRLDVPVIGFAGAPFTLASYLIEGKPSRSWTVTKCFMYERPDEWHQLMDRLTDGVIGYLTSQVEAGAQALQLFDSWVGCLSARDFREYVLPYSARIFTSLRRLGLPLIHFGTDTAAILEDFASVDADVIGIDWRLNMERARASVPTGKAVQGNLDPAVLLGDAALVKTRVDEIFAALPNRVGHIFNLGHGVLPETDDRALAALVTYVHAK
jgi:uroporphyrinogen decarboxylase